MDFAVLILSILSLAVAAIGTYLANKRSRWSLLVAAVTGSRAQRTAPPFTEKTIAPRTSETAHVDRKSEARCWIRADARPPRRIGNGTPRTLRRARCPGLGRHADV